MNDQKSNVLGETMRRARVAQGYQTHEIATILRTGMQTILRYEAGEEPVPAGVLERFAILVQRCLSIFYLPESPELAPRAEALWAAMAEAAPAMQEAADAVVGKLEAVLALHDGPSNDCPEYDPTVPPIEETLAGLAAEVSAEDWAALPDSDVLCDPMKRVEELEAELALWDKTCATCAYAMTHGGCPAIAAVKALRKEGAGPEETENPTCAQCLSYEHPGVQSMRGGGILFTSGYCHEREMKQRGRTLVGDCAGFELEQQDCAATAEPVKEEPNQTRADDHRRRDEAREHGRTEPEEEQP